MKLVWEYFDDTFSLVEDDKAGLAVICTSKEPTEIAEFSQGDFSCDLMLLSHACRGPSNPDIWQAMYGSLSKDPNVKIIEAEPIEYPEGAVF